MAIQKTEAFILKRQPFRSTSLMITAFSRSFGKVKGIIKGVRSEGVPHPGAFEPFNLVELVYYEKIRSDLHLISEVSVLESFQGLRSNLEALATAYYLVEIVDQLSEAHDPHEPIFELLHFAFQWLPSLEPAFLARFFEIRLLSEVGLLPHLGDCLGCGERNPGKVYFSAKQGAIFCPRCLKKAPEAKALSLSTLAAMQNFTQEKLGEAVHHPLEEKIEKEMREVTERFLMERLGKRLPARHFLNQVRRMSSIGKA